MRSINIDIPDYTEAEIQELRKERLNRKESLSLAYQLGLYVGEKIVSKFLPTISVDSIQTRKNISVTCAEGDEFRRLNDLWFNKRMKSKKDNNEESESEWNALMIHRKILEDKYLPDTIECFFPLINLSEKVKTDWISKIIRFFNNNDSSIENMADFKKGISTALWDCDCSHYSVNPEDILITDDEDSRFTIITLKRD